MASDTGSDKAFKVAATPPQLRIVGFTTSSSASDLPSEHCNASPHAVPESPLSRLLRSATWPTLRVRLCKNEIPVSGTNVHETSIAVPDDKDMSAAAQGRSTSPISIPRVYRSVRLLK